MFIEIQYLQINKQKISMIWLLTECFSHPLDSDDITIKVPVKVMDLFTYLIVI